MVKIKPLDAIKRNYENSSSTAAQRYKEETARTTGWQAAAIKGQKNYVEQMSKGDILARREKALQQSSDEEWRKGTQTVGANRIGEGIRNSGAEQQQGFAPYHAALSSLELVDRTTDPIANVQNRTVAVVKALHDKKKEILG